MNVSLNNLRAFYTSAVRHRDSNSDLPNFGESRRADGGLSIGEGRVREPVTKSKEWLDTNFLIMTISDVEAFSIDYLEILTWPIVVCGVVFESLWEGCLRVC